MRLKLERVPSELMSHFIYAPKYIYLDVNHKNLSLYILDICEGFRCRNNNARK